MKLHETVPRIRAAIRAVQVRAASSAAVITASIRAPYIVFTYVLGQFVKFITKADAVTVQSLSAFFLGRATTDTAAVSDAADVVPNKRPIDNLVVADVRDPFQLGKGLFEFPKAEEGPYFAEDYTDPGYTIVSFAVSFTKTATDSAAAADTRVHTLSRLVTDAADAADAVVLSRNSSIITAADAADSGSLRMQDYSDFGYFAEDYVGESRTF